MEFFDDEFSDDFFNDENSVFFNEFEPIEKVANVTINKRDLLLDNECAKDLKSFTPLTRNGTYNIEDSDRIYLYKNDMLDKLTVIDPFCYSDISESILQNTHDRGFSNGIDFEEMACQQKPFKKKTAKKVSFHENTEVKDFSTFNSPCNVKKSTAYAKTLNDNSNRCLLYTSPSPRDGLLSRMPSSA